MSPLRDITVVTQHVSCVVNSYFCSEAPDANFYLLKRVILVKKSTQCQCKDRQFLYTNMVLFQPTRWRIKFKKNLLV